ncbi:hypothetical protein VNO77_33924 [Canavalia gladiata]|uniref:Uncharacterized protein n=1 Tax=Canavalia gladiata TaxID=3824 RepID=A0AAN9Q195_CANGL
MPFEPRASWFSPKCVEAQQLTGHLKVKHCFGAGRESGSSTEGESGSKIRPKGVVDGQKVNIHVLPFVGPEGRRRLGKARTTFNKRVPVPETDTDHVWGLTPAQCRKVKEVGDLMTGELATEASVNNDRNYNGPKLRWRAKKASFRGGPEPSVRYHSGRARILTLCQDLWAKGQSQVWHLDVSSLPPGAVVCSKGWAIRPLKWYVSWVQNVVRQFGPYPVWALEH